MCSSSAFVYISSWFVSGFSLCIKLSIFRIDGHNYEALTLSPLNFQSSIGFVSVHGITFCEKIESSSPVVFILVRKISNDSFCLFPLPSKDKEKAVQEPVKEGKTKAATIKKPVRRRTTEAQAAASTSGTKAKDPATVVFQADEKQQQQAQQTVERRMMFATANRAGKDTKVVRSSDPLTRSISSSSIFPQKADLSKEEKAPLQKEIKEDISKFIEKVATSHPIDSIDDIDTAFSVITLAGDNRGATMHVGDNSRSPYTVPTKF